MAARTDGSSDESVRGQGSSGTQNSGSATVTDTTPPRGGVQPYTPHTQAIEHGVFNQTPASNSPQVAIHTPTPTNPWSSPRTQYAPNSVLQEQFAAGNTDFRQPMAPGTEQYLTGLAKHMGHNRTVNSIWQDAVDMAKNNNISVTDAITRIAQDAGFGAAAAPTATPTSGGGSRSSGGGGGRSSGGSGGGGGGGGGVSGMAQTSVSYDPLGEGDLKDLANTISMEMLGKGVTEKQWGRILQKVREKEAANPRVTTSQSGVGQSVTSTQPGVSNADRQDVIQNILQKAPQYGDYQKATTLMGFFDQALNERLQGG